MNCINCGAPAAKVCSYCGTPANVVTPGTDLVGFQTLLRMVKSFDFDGERATSVRAYARVGRRLTPGQVRAVLAAFDYDEGRLKAGKMLIPLTVDPFRLLEVGQVFDFDEDRGRFMKKVSEAAPVPPGSAPPEPRFEEPIEEPIEEEESQEDAVEGEVYTSMANEVVWGRPAPSRALPLLRSRGALLLGFLLFLVLSGSFLLILLQGNF